MCNAQTPERPFISVIIPTYNRSDLLPRTLDSFLAQTYPQDRFEIIVANNASTDETLNVVARYRHTEVRVSCITEPRQGVHFARNTAAKRAAGDILYFTDDDMVASPTLLERIVLPFSLDETVGSVTGRVVPLWLEPPPRWILEQCSNHLLSLHDRQERLIISPVDVGVFSCHQAIRKEAFLQSGGFNPENTAGVWIGDGETGLNIKLRSSGWTFAYVGDSVTQHIIPPTRTTQAYLNKRLANQGNCDSYTTYRRERYSKWDLAKQILKHTARGLLSCAKAAGTAAVGNSRCRSHVGMLFYSANRIRYDLRLMLDEEWRGLVLRDDWLSDDSPAQ